MAQLSVSTEITTSCLLCFHLFLIVSDHCILHVFLSVITIFSLFNVILVVDALGAAVKWMPRKFPKSKDEKTATEVLVRRTSATAMAAPSLELIRMLQTKRKFKGAVHSVILASRLSSLSSEKED